MNTAEATPLMTSDFLALSYAQLNQERCVKILKKMEKTKKSWGAMKTPKDFQHDLDLHLRQGVEYENYAIKVSITLETIRGLLENSPIVQLYGGAEKYLTKSYPNHLEQISACSYLLASSYPTSNTSTGDIGRYACYLNIVINLHAEIEKIVKSLHKMITGFEKKPIYGGLIEEIQPSYYNLRAILSNQTYGDFINISRSYRCQLNQLY